MKLSDKNKDAIKSSLLTGVAFALFALCVTQRFWPTVIGFLSGISAGLLTTWYCDE